jgi:hypothetical protein
MVWAMFRQPPHGQLVFNVELKSMMRKIIMTLARSKTLPGCIVDRTVKAAQVVRLRTQKQPATRRSNRKHTASRGTGQQWHTKPPIAVNNKNISIALNSNLDRGIPDM